MITSSKMRKTMLGASVAAALTLLSGAAWGEPQAVKVLTADFAIPGDADTWFYNQDTTQVHTNLLGNTQRPVEIKELARALGAGRYSADTYARTVFEYVYNNIGTEFRYGLSKGAIGALIDQSGTPFDQASLMVELLREQSGITASYVSGTITLDATEFSDWTGLTNAVAACRLLADGGIPGEINNAAHSATCSYATTLTAVKMSHVWVSAVIGGVTRVYDPSYKKHTVKTSVPLATALNCGAGCGAGARTAAMTGVGRGTFPATWVQDVNTTSLATQMRTYAYNMRSYIETNNRFGRIEDIVGGRLIDQTAMPASFSSTLPYDSSATGLRTWSEIPNAYRTKIAYQFDSIKKTMYADEVYGSLIGISVLTYLSPASRTATLKIHTVLDGVSTVLDLGSSTRGDGTTSNDTLMTTIDHPYYGKASSTAAFGTYMDDVLVHDTLCQFDNTGKAFSLTLSVGLGETGAGLMAHLARLRSYGTFASTATFGDLNAAWLVQRSRTAAIIGQVDQVNIHHHHSMGYVNTQNPGGASYVVNIESALSVVQAANNTNLRKAAIFAATTVMSGLEGGVSEQSFGSWEGGSSVTLMGLANEKHVRFYSATASNITSILNASTNYSVQQKAAINAYFPSGSTFNGVIANNGEIGSFSGPGNATATWPVMPFLAYTPAGDRVAYISGELSKGAGSGAPEDPAGALDTSLSNIDPAKPKEPSYSVDVSAGDMSVTSPVDIETGAGGFPRSLAFQREYRSSDVEGFRSFGAGCPNQVTCLTVSDREGILPIGWSHNFQIYARLGGNGLQGLGEDSALDASAAIAAIYTIADLFNSTTPTYDSRLTAIFTANWMVKQLSGNAVYVTRGARTEAFIRLPEAGSTGFTYNPPPGSQDTLIRSGSELNTRYSFPGLPYAYTIDMQLGVRDADGSLISLTPGDAYVNQSGSFYTNMFRPTAWTFPSGMRIDFTYQFVHLGEWPGGGNYQAGSPYYKNLLTKVKNNLGRELNFGYASMTAPYDQTNAVYFTVSDENGRQVQFEAAPQVNPQGAGGYLKVIGVDGQVTREDYTTPVPTVGLPPAYVFFQPPLRNRLWKITLPGETAPYVTFTYNALLQTTSSLDSQGALTSYFSAGGFGERLKRGESLGPGPSAALTTSYFDERGKLVQQIDPLLRVTSNEYDSAGRLTKTTYPEGNSVVRTYDLRHNLLTERQKAKQPSSLADLVTTYTYFTAATSASCPTTPTDETARCNKVVSIDGVRTDVSDVSTYAWNPNGMLARINAPAVPLAGSASNVSPQVDFCYTGIATANGTVSFLTGGITRINATNNRVMKYEYNSSNKFVIQSIVVDPAATLIAPATAGGACTSGAKSGALAHTTTPTFDSVGNVTSINGPRNDVTDVADIMNYGYDSMRRLTRIGAPLGAITRFQYDVRGRLEKTRRSRVELPAVPNEATIIESEWQTETRVYNTRGDLTSVTDAEANQTKFDLDELRRQRIVTDPNGRQTATVFDATGQPLCSWKGGTTWTLSTAPTACSYDPASYAATGLIRYVATTYTPNGQVQTVVDANNNTTRYEYDRQDRLRFTYFPNPIDGSLCTAPSTETGNPTCAGTAPNVPTYEKTEYGDGINPTVQRTRKNDTATTTYDAANRLISSVVPGLPTVSIGYDLVGNKMSVTSPALGTSIPAHSTTYDYDSAGRLLYEENLLPTTTPTTRRVSYKFDEAGNRTRTTWPDGYYVAYQYDALNRMQYARENSTTAGELAFYQYDVLSRRKNLRFAGQSTNSVGYTYELDSQLDVLTHVLNNTTVTLDHGHNLSGQLNKIQASDDFYLPATVTTTPIAVPTAYTPDKLNRYGALTISGAATAPTYDLNGNLLTWGPASSLQTYTYDAENRLRTANVTGGTNNSYDYDALGRRLSKNVGGTNTTFYLLDGDEEIAEYNSAGTMLRRYIRGPATDERIARQENSTSPTPTLTYYHVNHQGSVIATTNPNGTIDQQLAYDAYGNLTSQSPANATGEPFRFTGRRFDPETGLYYYRARYYSPQLGRFLQTDPVGYEDSPNSYAYAGNDPLGNTDPTGMNALNEGDVHCDADGCQEWTRDGFVPVIVVSARTGRPKPTTIVTGVHEGNPDFFSHDAHADLFGITRGGEAVEALTSLLQTAPVRKVGVWLVDSKGNRVVNVGEHLSARQLKELTAKLAKNQELVKAAKGLGHVAHKVPIVEGLYSLVEARAEWQSGHKGDATISIVQSAAAFCTIFCPFPLNAISLGVGIGISVGKMMSD